MSRNAEGGASPHSRDGIPDLKYGVDEDLRSVVQTAPPYPSISSDRRSLSPAHGSQEDHVRKKMRLNYAAGGPSTTSPTLGGYDGANDSERGPPQGYSNGHSYGYQAHSTYPQYAPPAYGTPASAPPLRDAYNQHPLPPGASHPDGTFSQAPAEISGVYQSRLSGGTGASPGGPYYARGVQQGSGGYSSYQAISQPSGGVFPASSTALGPPANIGVPEAPHTPLIDQETRHWSHTYGVAAPISPIASAGPSGLGRYAPIARTPVDNPSTYYSRSYPPYDERSLPPALTPSPYQQSTPQFTSPEAGTSLVRAEGPYASGGSSTTKAAGSTSTGNNAPIVAKSQALFVSKLYNMLEDPEIVASGLLKWSADGQGFVCSDPNEFARLFLSKYFKHANWHSFVRQLNMYGFNKQVNDVFQTLSQPADQPVAWEFRHSIFRRGDPSCVQRIKRRSVKTSSTVQRDLASSQIARPPGLPTSTTSTSFIYPSAYQAVSYPPDPLLQAGQPVMIPRYSTTGETYGLSGNYVSSPPAPPGSGPPPGWMPGSQYLGRPGPPPQPYQASAYLPAPDLNPHSNSQRSTSSLPSRTTESYTRHDRRPY
ncbi:hypothetical protein NliqN6_1119 [Naganishia liquefaciens]|uniref:HSF-type DNA-binding domain-containing protein n=1 Tax=Naganishia liquefaciens TaxID=104408 RepID=A0A8H3YDX9_9TREE|nr:hypothetical protein NliqN6_1119 [Naganishia liquefaciens]